MLKQAIIDEIEPTHHTHTSHALIVLHSYALTFLPLKDDVLGRNGMVAFLQYPDGVSIVSFPQKGKKIIYP